jgi:hypothetical protein
MKNQFFHEQLPDLAIIYRDTFCRLYYALFKSNNMYVQAAFEDEMRFF